MGKFQVGERVRSAHGWEATVHRVDGECFWLFSDGMQPEYASKYDINESFILLPQPRPAPDASPHEITLRDQFAMAALTGLCGNCDTTGEWQWTPAEVAGRAYEIASEMLVERKRAK